MERQRSPQQQLGDFGVIESQAVDGRSDQRLAVAFHLLGRPQVSPAPAARLSAMQHGTAKRTAFHRSGLKVEQQILQLPPPILQGRAVAAGPGVPDHFDQIDNFRPILLAGLVKFPARLR